MKKNLVKILTGFMILGSVISSYAKGIEGIRQYDCGENEIGITVCGVIPNEDSRIGILARKFMAENKLIRYMGLPTGKVSLLQRGNFQITSNKKIDPDKYGNFVERTVEDFENKLSSDMGLQYKIQTFAQN